MASEQNLSSVFTDTADAIREKTGKTDKIKPINFADEIKSISTSTSADDGVLNSLIEKTITEFSNNKITTLGDYIFYACDLLTSIDLPVCTSVGGSAFQECTSLTSVNLPVCRTIYGAAFYGCYSLTSIDLPVCTTINYNAFYSCKKLTSINLPVCTSINGNAFRNCVSLTSIDLPVCASISGTVFTGCSSLTTLIIRTSSVCTFSSTTALTNTPIETSSTEGFIYVPDDLVGSYKTATNWSTYASKIRGLSQIGYIIDDGSSI